MQLLDKFRTNINNLTLYKKISYCSLFVIGILTVCSLAMYLNTSRIYSKLLYKESANSLSFISKNITSQLQVIDNSTELLVVTQTIQYNLSQHFTGLTSFQQNRVRENTDDIFYTYFNSNKYIDSITVVADGFTVCTGNTSLQESADYIKTMSDAARANRGKELWFPSQSEEGTVLLVRSILKVENLDLSQLGILIVRVSLNELIEAVMSNYDFLSDNSPLIIYANSIFYHPNTSQDVDISTLTDTASQPYSIIDVNGAAHFCVTKKMREPDWTYSLLVPYDTIFHTITTSVLTFIIILISLAIIVLIISNIMIKNITIHFSNLTSKMASLRSGNTEVVDVNYDYNSRHDEIGILHQNFDVMLHDFKHLTLDNYTKQILLKDTQLKALRQQINPHFLYNTLDSINWKAKSLHDSDISVMVESLGKLLRYAISEQGDLITLAKELEITDYYINIQKIRFGDRLNYQCDIDSSLLDTQIPKMSIQPLLENAVKYGVEQLVSPGFITLLAAKDENEVIIRVTNDGSEIPANVLELLQSGELKSRGFGIGLQNIDSRIKLLYGEAYGLSFTTKREVTTVTMHLPYQTITTDRI